MKEIMAVFDTEAGYAENLAFKLMAEQDFPYYVQGFSSLEELTVFLSEHQTAVLLADRKDMTPELMPFIEKASGKETELIPYGASSLVKLIYLTEISGYPEIGQHAAVYKYQSVKRLSAEILEAARRQENRAGAAARLLEGVRYIGVAGPIGHAGKTSFCLTLGQLLAGQGRVLYMNLEPLAGLDALFEESFDQDLSDLVYCCMTSEGTPDYTRLIHSFHGLDLVPPVKLPEDLYRTEPEILFKTVRKITTDCRYDTVLLDFGCEFRVIEAFLPGLNKLFIPSRQDVLSQKRIQAFLAWVRRVDEKADLMEPEELFLPVPRAFLTGKNYLEQLLWSETGDYVRALLERES